MKQEKITTRNMAVKALVIRTAGTNCDQETIHALKLCGATSDLVHINKLLKGQVRLHPYHAVVFPGGFSYGDDVSAGKVLANELKFRLGDQLRRYVESKRPIVGICNGFQVLVKAGLLPGFQVMDETQKATLCLNDSGRFQCQWSGLILEKSAADWLGFMPAKLDLPIAHGEGKFITAAPRVLSELKRNKQIVFRYFPKNPNGSQFNIAGICNKWGNVVGMMPHPERFVSPYQHPNWPLRKIAGDGEFGDGYWFWKSVVEYAKKFVV